jgi:hypothetical protein
MSFAHVRRGQLCKQGVVVRVPIVSTIVSTLRLRAPLEWLFGRCSTPPGIGGEIKVRLGGEILRSEYPAIRWVGISTTTMPTESALRMNLRPDRWLACLGSDSFSGRVGLQLVEMCWRRLQTDATKP